MPIGPIRNLGQYGVITDQDPLLLPPAAFTMGVNARFEDNTISRGPVFRKSGPLSTNSYPRYAVSYKQTTGNPNFVVFNDDGTAVQWSPSGIYGSSESPVTASGWTASTYQFPYTGTLINDVVYVNRPDRVPWYKATGGSSFATIPNWDSSWRCQALRSVAGVCVAINVTKGATVYPTMVKTSDYMVYDSTPGSWVASTTNSATENILADLQEPLVDGCVLRDRMVLYSQNETWLMEPRYDNLMFNYRRIWRDRGLISQNCVVEHDSIHYVFGNDDIWKHDGFTPVSLAAGVVRDFIFNNLVKGQTWQFFVTHAPRQSEVIFCYLSTDPYCAFPVGGSVGYPGCNRAAVWNYRANTWQFYDLPYVTSSGLLPPVTGLTYTNFGSTTYTNLSGTYSSFGDTSKLALMMVAPVVGALPASVRSFELVNSVAANGTVDSAATAPVYLENAQIDLDSLGVELRGYKVIRAIYPAARFDPGAAPLSFSFGSADYQNSPPPVYGTAMTYDGASLYKLDYMTAGRFLSCQIRYSDPSHDFSLIGLDMDFSVTGHR